jgi:type II secretory pathway pseudopilin PulG
MFMQRTRINNSPAVSPTALAAGAGVAPARAGFTLIETIVAVGAVAIVAVGLASIFSAVGKTVAGGQRLSSLNQFSALIEDRMRDDIDQMTRDGVLVIRQQWVDVNGDGTFNATSDRVPVSLTDASPRARRIDELMFFAEGRFRSSRPTMHPGVVAESDVARIYYGHGQRRRAPLTSGGENSDPYYRPLLSENNNEATSLLGAQSGGNPNRFAGDWTLVRHQTLLIEPSQVPQQTLTGSVLGVDPGTPAGRALLANRDGQVALQPAAGSIFRALTRRFPDQVRIDNRAANFLYPNYTRPVFGGGLIDIANSDLAELRSFVLSFRFVPGDIDAATDVEEGFFGGAGEPPIGAYLPSTLSASRPGVPQSIDLMHAWMDDLMPTRSSPVTTGNDDQLGAYRAAGAIDPASVRIRTEPAGPDLLRVVSGTATSTTRELGYLRADQIALASGGFLPRCSEFIVEWSFGNTDALGATIWHGLPRREADSNGNGTIDAGDFSAASLFIPDLSDATDPSRVRTRVGTGPSDVHDLTARVVYGYVPAETQTSLTSFFGYVDPTFDPAGQPSTVTAQTLHCPWPRLIRVTVTVSDATDPSIETTFQYVFRTPEDPVTQN